jgi:hypothetical protein
MTPQQYQDWLSRPGRRVVLAEIDMGGGETILLSNVAYTTLPTDAVPNRAYLPYIQGGVAFTSRLTIDGSPSVSIGDIEVSNEDGHLDWWLDRVWTNRRIQVYHGDVSWPLSDFQLVLSGVIDSLGTRSAARLNIVIKDNLQRLNTPVSEAVVGGEGTNKENLAPLVLGECHNVSPVLYDEAQHEYLVTQNTLESILEVRDNGVPVGFTLVGTNRFRLTASPAGAITASVQGGAPYTNKIGSLVKVLATQWGSVEERLLTSEIDSADFTAFDAAYPQPVGVFLDSRANVLATCQELAASVGAQVVTASDGRLRIRRITVPATASGVQIKPTDYVSKSLSPGARPAVKAGVRLTYCKNWTVQEGLTSGIPGAHKDLFAKEWLEVQEEDADVAALHRIFTEPVAVETLLLVEADARAEAVRRLGLWSTQRKVYNLTGYSQLLTLELGDPVTLFGSRWGLNNGVPGMVLSLGKDWIAGRVDIEVLV